MKYFRLVFLFLVAFALSQNAFSQSKLSGKVVEVLDGKTAVVQMGTSGKLTVVLQYVEIPEAEQPLNAVVKQHLTNLLLGKTVLLLPRGVVNSQTVAQVFVGGVDVSQQMLRDGAAWFALPEKTEKSRPEVAVYQSNEAQAKAEKRGIWSIENLQPAWQFRAEKEQRQKAEELAKLEEIKKQRQAEFPTVAKKKLPPPPAFFSNFEMWKDNRTSGMWDEMQFYAMDQQYNENGVMVFRSEKVNISFVVTKDVSVGLSNGASKPKITCAIAYITGKLKDDKEQMEVFLMGCKSQSEKQNFKPTSQLTFTTDSKKINFSKVVHLGRQSDKRYDEMMLYFLDRSAVTKIAASENVQIKMGDFSGAMPANFHTMTKNLVFESARQNYPQTAKGN